MALETGSFIDDLTITNPLGADAKNEGDDHIRLIKKVLKATFPGMGGAAWRVQTKTGTYTVAASDNMTTLNCTTALTLNLTAAATLGNQHLFYVMANGGAITIDPDGAETVNGSATLVLSDGETAVVVCTGSAFLAAVSGVIFPAGTLMLFQQTAAPTGWTKETTHDDKALRIVTGSVSSGGATAFSSVFGSAKTAGGTTLTKAQLPDPLTSAANATVVTSGGGPNVIQSGTGGGSGVVANIGGGNSHDHTLSLDLNYVDLIIASKD